MRHPPIVFVAKDGNGRWGVYLPHPFSREEHIAVAFDKFEAEGKSVHDVVEDAVNDVIDTVVRTVKQSQ